jgi:hypothetical protein
MADLARTYDRPVLILVEWDLYSNREYAGSIQGAMAFSGPWTTACPFLSMIRMRRQGSLPWRSAGRGRGARAQGARVQDGQDPQGAAGLYHLGHTQHGADCGQELAAVFGLREWVMTVSEEQELCT